MKKIVLCSLIGLFCVTGIFGQVRNGKQLAEANAVLMKVGKIAEDSFYSCLLNSYNQGRSPAQAREECATKLLEDDQKGFGGSIGDLKPGSESFFDPSKITAACNSGDPSRGQTSGQTSGSRTIPGWGTYSWGKEVKTSDGNTGIGLTQQVAEQWKIAKSEEATVAWTEYNRLLAKELEAETALKEAKKSGDEEQIKKAQNNLASAKKATNAQGKKALNKSEEASQDPNSPDTLQTTREPSACEQSLDAAREILRECLRTGWKDFRCQELKATKNKCPDPALILVDPDQGYSCGAKVDPEAVKNAWVAKCDQRVKVMPDTPNPCSPPTFDAGGRGGKGKMGDICGNPYGQTDPDNDGCSNVIIGEQFGKINIQGVIVVGLNKLGGPIFVLPKNPKPPRPGTDPRPGPTH